MKKCLIIIPVLLCTWFNKIKAQMNVVTTAVPMLRISPEARAGGMGNVSIATTADANAVFHNIGKLPFAEKNASLSLNYIPWMKNTGANDVFLGTLGGYYKIDDDQVLSTSLRYFSLGDIQFTDFSGQQLQTGHPREYSVDAGYSRRLGEQFGLGITLRYINSSLANGVTANGTTYKAGNSVSGDISFFYNGVDDYDEGWTAGATLTNLGSKISYSNDATNKDFIPANLGLGATYTKHIDEVSTITFGIDLNKLLVPSLSQDSSSASLQNYHNQSVVSSWFSSFGSNEVKKWQASLGVEYKYDNLFAARAGYFYEDKDNGNRKYFTVGAGVYYKQFGLNLSYLIPTGSNINRNPLNNSLQIGFLFDFGQQ